MKNIDESVNTWRLWDGFHTFDELYAHRNLLFINLCKMIDRFDDSAVLDKTPWKSRLHANGTMFDGYFIAGIGTEPGEQITYHLPLKFWDLLDVVEVERAPEWDGHTSDDVLKRLTELLPTFQPFMVTTIGTVVDGS